MIATGVGIAAHLPCLRKLSHGQINFQVRPRRILVLWMFEKDCTSQLLFIYQHQAHNPKAHLKVVKEWMVELLTTDTPGRVSGVEETTSLVLTPVLMSQLCMLLAKAGWTLSGLSK
jgi:hypothetical protein